MKKITLLIFTILCTNLLWSQTQITGTVKDSDNNPLPGANVIEKGTTNGTSTDFNGKFTLTVKKNTTLVVSFSGYTTKEVKVNGKKNLTITLSEGLQLEEVVVTGNRAKPRTILDSAVPIDNISLKELKTTGQANIDQMLTYSIPSYNSSNQTVSDATAHFDPADLRGLGPSRTLVLVNGKRKNQSALVYVNDTPGKGEVGTDMKSIPTAAIERVEVLRDGASAQYGSDAVAGVVNIILKKGVEFSELNVKSGITSKGDGVALGADINHTFSFGEGGFVNASLSLSHQGYTNRAAEPGKDGLFGVVLNDPTLLNGTNSWIQQNPDLGMIIGQPEVRKGDVFINAEYPLNKDTKLYAFGGYNMRKGKSFALYRTPYWPGISTDPNKNPLYDGNGDYQGFQPTFETDINDVLFTTGIQFKILEFNADLSLNYGGNSVDYTIGNTINPSLGANSPTSFYAGAYGFNNIVGNFDVNRAINDNLSIGLGVEARRENFEVTAGEKASYVNGGAQSFPGLQPSNALNETRTNVGLYGTLDWDITKKLLIGGALRYENYSDFGGNTSWKINSRYKMFDNTVLRGSYSTGFRAPSLHQVYLSNVQTLVSGGTISNQGTFNNVSSVIKSLEVAPLFAETSKNISAGITLKATKKFSISLDYYNVKVNDRVLFTGEINAKDDNGNINTDVQNILTANKVTSIKFFTNAVNTKTSGFDAVLRYRNIDLGNNTKLNLNASLNLNETTLEGEVRTPGKLANYKNKIFNRKEQSRVISARPKTKFLLGANVDFEKLNVGLNNTYFGEVTWQHASDVAKDQTFSGKVVTDLSFAYNFSEKIAATFIINNLLNVYPDAIDTKGDFVTDLGGRFKYPWEVNQFGFNGTNFSVGFSYSF